MRLESPSLKIGSSALLGSFSFVFLVVFIDDCFGLRI